LTNFCIDFNIANLRQLRTNQIGPILASKTIKDMKYFHFVYLVLAIAAYSCSSADSDNSDNFQSEQLVGELQSEADSIYFTECGTNRNFTISKSIISKDQYKEIKELKSLYIEAELLVSADHSIVKKITIISSDPNQKCAQNSPEFKPGVYILHASKNDSSINQKENILEFLENRSAFIGSNAASEQAIQGVWTKGDNGIITIIWSAENNKPEWKLSMEKAKTLQLIEPNSEAHFDYQGPSRQSLIEQALFNELAEISSIRDAEPVSRDQLSVETPLKELMTNEIQWKSFNNYLVFFFKMQSPQLEGFREEGKKISDVALAIYCSMLERGAMIKKVVVGPELGDCGSEELECLKVYEGDWKNLGQPIENFKYEPGTMYQIFLTEERNGMDANGNPLIKRTLIKEMETKKVQANYRLHDVWALKVMNDKEVKGVKFCEYPYLEMHLEDSRVMGNTGCNRLFGEFSLSNDSLKFGNLATTRMMCEEIAQFESEMLQTLALVDSYRFLGPELEFLSKGKSIMTFKKVD